MLGVIAVLNQVQNDNPQSLASVIPAQAGISNFHCSKEIPACAGMTGFFILFCFFNCFSIIFLIFFKIICF
jgi:hypothetical protein